MQFVLAPVQDRAGKRCYACGSKVSVKYRTPDKTKYFCSRCALSYLSIEEYMKQKEEREKQQLEEEDIDDSVLHD